MALPVSTAPFRAHLAENLEDVVSGELMAKAVTLVPCGHTFNEDTVIKCLARNKLCPLDRQPIDRYVPNYTVRHLVETSNQYPADEPPTEEACNYFQQGKILSEQNNYEGAIEALLKALQISPTHEKAQGYLDFCLQHTSKSSQPQPLLFENNNPSPKETYIDQLLYLIDSQLVQNNAPLKACLGILIEELMSQEAEKLTPRQTESYKWFQKLVTNNKVSDFVAKKLQQLVHSTKSKNEPVKPATVQPSPKALPAVSVQAASTPALPAWVFGAAEWKKHIGDPGVEPPLPLDIIQRLDELKVNNVLVLIPATVNGRPLDLKTLGELVQKPLQGHATKFQYFSLGEYVDRPTPKSHWAFLTRTIIVGSRNKLYKDEQTVLNSHSQMANMLYEMPTILDVSVCMFMEYVRSGIWLYRDIPLTYALSSSFSAYTYIWCQEEYSTSCNLVVGRGTVSTDLAISRSGIANPSTGIAGLKRLW